MLLISIRTQFIGDFPAYFGNYAWNQFNSWQLTFIAHIIDILKFNIKYNAMYRCIQVQ